MLKFFVKFKKELQKAFKEQKLDFKIANFKNDFCSTWGERVLILADKQTKVELALFINKGTTDIIGYDMNMNNPCRREKLLTSLENPNFMNEICQGLKELHIHAKVWVEAKPHHYYMNPANDQTSSFRDGEL